MRNVLKGRLESDFLERGFSRRDLGRLAAFVTAGATLPFYNEPALAQLSALGKLPADAVKINSNENPLGPCTEAVETMYSVVKNGGRYQYESAEMLATAVAEREGLRPDHVTAFAGSSDPLHRTILAFTSPRKSFVMADPTYEAGERGASFIGSKVFKVPLAKDLSHDVRAMVKADPNAGVIYICNPNNPTASITPRKDLETFISKLPATCHVLIDEAYHHFAGQSSMYASFIDHPVNDDRVIVCRTFSKVYGMAGLRLGYGIASPAMIDKMNAYMTFDSINAIVVPTAMAAMDDTAGLNESVRKNADERQEFFNQAMSRMLRPIDSHANFMMMDTHHPAAEVIEHFRKNNVLIGRPFPPMDTYVRISLGLPEEMRAFWRTWDLLPYAKGQMRH